MDVFLSYSPADRKWAEKLHSALERQGLTSWLDTQLRPGEDWLEVMRHALAEAKNIVFLVGSSASVGGAGSFRKAEAQAALETIWGDPEKRFIPILLGDAKLPSFLRSAVPFTSTVEAIRVPNLRRDWSRAVADTIQVLKNEVDLSEKAVEIDTRDEDRALLQERLSYLRQVAASFKD